MLLHMVWDAVNKQKASNILTEHEKCPLLHIHYDNLVVDYTNITREGFQLSNKASLGSVSPFVT